MRQFKVGDKLIVKDNLNDITNFYGGYIPDMNEFIGRVVTVERLDGSAGVIIKEDINHYTWDNRAFVIFNDIVKTKSGLQNGDIVKLRNGDRLLLIGGRFFDLDYSNCNNILDMDDINSDLSYRGNSKDYDIVKVARSVDYYIVYNRDNIVKEMTIEEISKALGYEVKIVKEKGAE